MSDDDIERQNEEFDALIAMYGDESVTKIKNGNVHWQIQIMKNITLDIQITPGYPRTCPVPNLIAPPWIIDDQYQKSLKEELLNLYEEDLEVAIVWIEHCRENIQEYASKQNRNKSKDKDNISHAIEKKMVSSRSFIPHTSKYGQPIRTFDVAIVDDDLNRREIYQGEPLNPPKGGPGECMIAHVASVTNMNHVYWVLHELLFANKKIGEASHNMFAYRFREDKEHGVRLVSDSDDDGEKGAGNKLASLLDLTGAEDCIVMVSRWYGES